MVEQTIRRAPRPVVAALAVLLVGYVAVIADGPWTSVGGVIANVVVAAVAAVLVYGLWWGSRSARGVVVLAMAGNLTLGLLHHAQVGWWRAVSMVAALVIIMLLLVPRSSRRWFAAPPTDSVAHVEQDSEQPVDFEALWTETDSGERR
ncbi:hypothetical protein [Micromonospora auratinigra]|uniref:hypothetical protein n=1 Tax=Micromonospora auratinigra TaxID=261654 RepID=UPI000AF2A912|nr:hypothetical protein [Micromonospora auratinigra]